VETQLQCAVAIWHILATHHVNGHCELIQRRVLMSRNNYAFSVLQATAAVASLAIIMWSLGFPVLQFAEAANVTTFSNTLTDSAPSVVSDHTIEFVTPTGVAAGETIEFTFDANFTGLAGLDDGDVDLNIDGVDAAVAAAPSGATWGATFTATTIIFTSGTGTVGPGDAVVVQIGLNADSGANQITNPATAGVSYEINVSVAADADTGETRVAIVDAVTVTATVDTIFTFSVAGTAAGTDVNGIGADATGGPTTATAIPFGELTDGNASTAAQQLTVSTNAANGFVVTVAVDQQLTSSNSAVIDSFIDGAFTATPAAWASPSGSLGAPNEAGHWGLSSNDATLTAGLSDIYTGGTEFVSASTTPVEVFRHDGPADATNDGEGIAEVLYKVEITALQEAAEDYTATLTYVATPVF
jgi:hypothetical protein